jgi:uncharacterized membrane protein (UPF0127 family)
MVRRSVATAFAVLAIVGGCRAEPPPPAAPAASITTPAPAASITTPAPPAAVTPLATKTLATKTLATAPLQIMTAAGVRSFTVEMAVSEAEQARGLMYRTELAPDAGMLFPLAPPRMTAFWMRNTLIPLDMIFIRADGTIARIAANTVPYSLNPVSSGEPVAAVLEIAGGQAARAGIAEGDKVRWPGGPS